eukprot:gnl/Spiro4/6320_TR3252_c0_g1_i1.p1 gnl/Spiro4/6320_TR3252_c0_g1~~gnl/Spiro4/6320_TR3252_c0_g1_i1.p1  ORF type:complete len:210 (-),score=12.02 gnl/Spiro4/6320_TR3252_c0_g1_i1:279-908(-)
MKNAPVGARPAATPSSCHRSVPRPPAGTQVRTLGVGESLSDLRCRRASSLRTLDCLCRCGPGGEACSLREVDCSGSAVVDVSGLAACRGLTSLDLSGTPIEHLNPLSCCALRSLKLRGCTRLREVAPLAGCSALTQLDISECPGVRTIPLALRENTRLTVLGFSPAPVKSARAEPTMPPAVSALQRARKNASLSAQAPLPVFPRKSGPG